VKTDLSKFNNDWYYTGRSKFICILWYLVNALFIRSSFPIVSVKRILLRLFGAQIGENVIIKPGVNIKYPWHLSVGHNSWIGEDVWLDTVGKIRIGNDCCISQAAKIITGNHNYKKESFDLIVHSILLEDGVWIGCGAVLCGSVICGEQSVLTAGSVTSKCLEPNYIYTGTPAKKMRMRYMRHEMPQCVLQK
jgi:putative colanic acid biosynthesis acetyltransferase WcaF